MIPITQKIERTGTDFKAKTWRGFLKDAWAKAGRFWFRKILGKHFKTSAKSEYDYQPRKPGYMKRKAKRFGHQKPLVLSGNLQRMVGRIENVRETSKGANVTLHGPRYLYMYRKNLKEVDKAKELRAVSEKDAGLLGEVLDKNIVREANKTGKKVNMTKGHRI